MSLSLRAASSSWSIGRRGMNSSLLQKRFTYSESIFAGMPPPPPKEFLADGVTPKKYPLIQPVYDHGVKWEQWAYHPAGMFHSVYIGEKSEHLSWFKAWVRSLPVWVAFPVLFCSLWSTAYCLLNFRYIGVKPKRYTPEWINAAKERERAENTNPVTRYMDRRRRERGPHFVLGNVLPFHQYFIWMRNSHDYEAAEAMLARRAKDAEDDEE